MDGAAEFEIAADADPEVVKMAFQVFDREKVGEGLGGVVVAAVPGVDDGIEEYMEATSGAPSFGWRMAQISAYEEMMRIVSATLSPFAAELESAEEKPRTLPPRLIMAASKLSLVRVLGS